MDAHALHRRGWTISAIARHLGHDRKTIRAYLNGERVAGQRKRRCRTGSTRSPTTAASVSPRTRTCGRPRCSTSCSSWATTARIRRSPASSEPAGCARRVRPAARRRDGRTRRSSTRPGSRPSSTGSSSRPARAVGVGHDGVPAGRVAGALQPLARGAGRVHRPATPDRRPAPGRRRARRAHADVAVRPDGHGLPPRVRRR